MSKENKVIPNINFFMGHKIKKRLKEVDFFAI